MTHLLRFLLLSIAAVTAPFCHGLDTAAGESAPNIILAAAEQPPLPPAAAEKNLPAAPAVKPPVRETVPAKPTVKAAPPVKPPLAKKTPPGIPEKVLKVLEYVDKNGKTMEGYEGGRNFGNFERLLPQNDKKGQRIRYREWDVNPRRPGVNRGAERMITGSDNHAYYTSDHYKSFKTIR